MPRLFLSITLLALAPLALALGAASSVFAQDAGTTVDGAIPPAPRGHAQPTASSSPGTAGAQPDGVQAVDPASRVQKNLENANQQAVDSICTDCLPKKKKKPRS